MRLKKKRLKVTLKASVAIVVNSKIAEICEIFL